MKRKQLSWARVAAAAALFATTLACSSVPVRFDAPKQPLLSAQGRNVEAEACGFQLLLLIPIETNSRASRAYSQLQSAAGQDVLTDIRVTERWIYGLVGTAYCTKLSATAYPRA